jgi:hypothetical protein
VRVLVVVLARVVEAGVLEVLVRVLVLVVLLVGIARGSEDRGAHW